MLAPDIDPVAIALGPLKIHWYGLMYLLGFTGGWAVGVVRAKRPNSGWTPDAMSDALFYLVLGTILGGRLGYALFYKPEYYLSHPIEIAYLWQGGMSFHGGLVGICFALYLFARKTNRPYLAVTDFLCVLAPLGLMVGRIGNFINQELWGKVAVDLPWAMVFKTGGPLPRHPSQLYESFLEGFVLFLILWFYTQKPRPMGVASGIFLAGYGVFRFAVEFVREPDAHLGYLAFGWVTMGQILCLPMIALGLYFFWRAKKANATA
jgi:phosphatidylglycerol:prolipoprotein diacylglycerol transferase